MKADILSKISLSILITPLLIFLSTSAAVAETYKVDGVHTYIMFRIKHVGVGYSYGRINSPLRPVYV